MKKIRYVIKMTKKILFNIMFIFSLTTGVNASAGSDVYMAMFPDEDSKNAINTSIYPEVLKLHKSMTNAFSCPQLIEYVNSTAGDASSPFTRRHYHVTLEPFQFIPGFVKKRIAKTREAYHYVHSKTNDEENRKIAALKKAPYRTEKELSTALKQLKITALSKVVDNYAAAFNIIQYIKHMGEELRHLHFRVSGCQILKSPSNPMAYILALGIELSIPAPSFQLPGDAHLSLIKFDFSELNGEKRVAAMDMLETFKSYINTSYHGMPLQFDRLSCGAHYDYSYQKGTLTVADTSA